MSTPLRSAVLALGWAVLITSAPAQERMTPELLWELGRVADPQISPDGATLLYNVRRYDLAANRGSGQVYALDLASRQHRLLTGPGSNSGARWSPDGQRIAFVSSRGGSPQIHVMDFGGGEARQVTDVENGVSNMAWSPDGKWLSFTSTVAIDPQLHDLYADLPHADARIYDDLMVRHWDEWNDGTYSHLFVVPSEGGEARDLMAGMRVDTPLKPFGGGEQICWAHDSDGLVYTAKVASEPQTSTNSDLFAVKLDGTDHDNLTDGMPGYETNPSFAPNGQFLAFASMARGGYESDQNRLFVLARSGERREVAQWDLSVGEFAWAPHGRALFVAADVRGTHQVFHVGIDGGEPRAITEGRWNFDSIAPSPANDAVYAVRAHSERPGEIVRVPVPADLMSKSADLDPDSSTSPGIALTDINGEIFAGLEMPTVEERWFDATDGQKIHAWVVKPPGFDPSRKYPMLTYCQGGPQSQVGQAFSYRWNFHLMAAQGYVVLGVNRRGLPGFGTKWNEEISRDWGGQAMRDLLAATDAMFEESWIDRAHTAAVGASFGGYSVYWLMGHDQPDRFCAMIAHCGVFDLRSMSLATEELFFVNWDLGGPFWRDPDVLRDYQRFSPSEFIGEWDTPLLVFHGQKDYRVPVEQGLQAFTAAQEQGVPSRFVYFPDEGHWVLSPQNGVLWHRLFFDWLDRWCKPKQ